MRLGSTTAWRLRWSRVSSTSVSDRTWALLVGVSMLLMASSSAAAQASASALDFDATRIVIEELDDDAAKCGITAGGLDAAVRLPVSTVPQLRVVSTGSGLPYIYVNVNALTMGSGSCAASYEVHLRRWSSEFQRFVSVWNKGGMMSGPASSFGSRNRQNIEDLTKEFLAAWLKERTQ